MLLTECFSSSRLSHYEERVYNAIINITIEILIGPSNSSNVPIKYKKDR